MYSCLVDIFALDGLVDSYILITSYRGRAFQNIYLFH